MVCLPVACKAYEMFGGWKQLKMKHQQQELPEIAFLPPCLMAPHSFHWTTLEDISAKEQCLLWFLDGTVLGACYLMA
jgi:hypothetical protein